MTTVGKRVADELYVHLSAREHLASTEHQEIVARALTLLPLDAIGRVNVARINIRSGRVSLLEYSSFDEDPFPVLRCSWTASGANTLTPTCRSFEQSLNPPVLHRKELLVASDHPNRTRWQELTQTAQQLGLFDDTSTIGFQLNWERLIASKGYRISGHEFLPLGNDTQGFDGAGLAGGTDEPLVRRHLTALSRSGLSAPVQMLLRYGLLTRDHSFLDYGCGRGDDVAALADAGFVTNGWDPHYAPDHAVDKADVLNIGFVINVIEDPAERVEALERAFRLSRQVMSVAVMLYGPELAGRPYRDGFVTTRDTFQKYFSQSEFKDYLEHVLNQEAFLVGPGIAFVFADEDCEQRFQAGRYRVSGIADRLLVAQTKLRRTGGDSRSLVADAGRGGADGGSVVAAHRRVVKRAAGAYVPKLTQDEKLIQVAGPQLEALWSLALDLGRYPEPEEAQGDALIAQVGSWSKVWRLIGEHHDGALLQRARQARADDLRLYFAMQHFTKRPRYRQLEARLQRDIKAFFGDYATARAAGLQLLVNAADSSELLNACRDAAAAGLGWIDGEHSLQLHAPLVERLPVVLRAYVACGLIIYGALGDVDLVKIHITSGKLTLMEFEDFETGALPRMNKRIKVNVRKQVYDVFEYGSDHVKPLLYHKSRYIDEETLGYAEQVAFDEALNATGLLSDSEFGPSEADLLRELELRRLEVSGRYLIRSRNVPPLCYDPR